jgi:hypothetical protein
MGVGRAPRTGLPKAASERAKPRQDRAGARGVWRGSRRRGISRPNGIDSGPGKPDGRSSPSKGPKALPVPIEPAGRARGAVHQKRDGLLRHTPVVR